MNFFEGIDFFILLGILSVPAVILGLLNLSIKYYGIFATIVFIWEIVGDEKAEIIFLFAYCVYQLLLLNIASRIKKHYTIKNNNMYFIAIIFIILPLAFTKISALALSEPIGFIGISYITFKALQLFFEIYDGVIQEIKVIDTLYFLLFFPTLSSGPIDRSRRFITESNAKCRRTEYIQLLAEGVTKVIQGLVYKTVIGFFFYNYMQQYGMENTLKSTVLYMYLYGFYLFFDFAGYSLMAIGTSNIFGIRTPDNFNKPFISVDIKDFWNRWHMTLSFWFRDFVFSRLMLRFIKNKWFKDKLVRANVAYIINMTIMGFWHGLTLSYVLYGVYHGVLLALNEVYQRKSGFYKKYKKNRVYKIFSWFVTFNLIMFGFFIFSGRFVNIIELLIRRFL